MKNTFLLLFVSLLFVTLTQAQVERDLGSFDEVIVSGGIELTLVKGEEGKASIDLMGIEESDLSIKLQGSTIKFSLLKSLWEDAYARITLQYEDIYALKAMAGSELMTREPIVAKDLELKVQSGSNADLIVEAEYLDVMVSEGAYCTLSGKVIRQDGKVHTGAKYTANDLSAERTVIRAHTGGEAYVHASKFFDGYATTGGEIVYSGDPEEERLKSNLAGEIQKK